MTTRSESSIFRAGSASPFQAFIASLDYLSNAEGRINSDPNNYDAYYQDEQYTLVAARRGRRRALHHLRAHAIPPVIPYRAAAISNE